MRYTIRPIDEALEQYYEEQLIYHHCQESLCGTERILPVSLSGRTDPEKSAGECGDDEEKQFFIGTEQRKFTRVRNSNDFHAGGN